MSDTARNLRPDAFAGTAAAYLRYRPPYPRRLLDDLLAWAGTPGGVLLDLASGPGRVALDLAGAFARVRANDLEPEMIAAAKAEAARRSIHNVTWAEGRAEDLEIAPASIDLITIGEAFHRLDQVVITAKAMLWLRPGGGLVTLGTDGVLAGEEPWKARAVAVARRWFPEGWAAGAAGAALDRSGVEALLRTAGFVDVESRDFAEPRAWSPDEIVGYLRSTSVCSEHTLGAGFPAFEAELRAALGDGPFGEAMRCGYTLSRKPS